MGPPQIRKNWGNILKVCTNILKISGLFMVEEIALLPKKQGKKIPALRKKETKKKKNNRWKIKITLIFKRVTYFVPPGRKIINKFGIGIAD